jgi:curved DNA-binding protein
VAADHYATLGVARSADADELQQAFRALARKHHPDVNKDPASEGRFKEINLAYSVLSDPEKRAQYDRIGAEGPRPGPRRRADPGASAPSGGPGSPRWGAGSAAGNGGYEPGDVDVDDLLESLLRGRRSGSGPMAGADQEAGIELTFDEAFRGGRRTLTLTGGTGERSVDVAFPAGVLDGQRIRVAGEGGRGAGTGGPGDLYLRVMVRPHPRYRLEGRDVHVDLALSPWEAALGTTVLLEAPSGEAKVRVPAGSSSGRSLRLRGEGMPGRPGVPAGDLRARIKIMVPPEPTPAERALFDQLAVVSSFDPRRAS